MNDLGRSPLRAKATGEKWSVIVLYEDLSGRDRALSVCDHLVKSFWSEVEFDFRWWRLDFLADSGMAQTAATDARDADIFIFSSIPQNELPLFLLRWFEMWAGQREDLEGIFLDLSEWQTLDHPCVRQKQTRLKDLAARAHLEYFSRVPSALSGPLFDSWQGVEARATEVTSVLNGILSRVPPPTHFGLNE